MPDAEAESIVKDSQSSGEDGVIMNNCKSLCHIEVGTSLSEGPKEDGISCKFFSHGNKIIINAKKYLVGWSHICKEGTIYC